MMKSCQLFCSNELSPIPISILKTKERYHTQPKVVTQQQNPILVVKFKFSIILLVLSHFSSVSTALLQWVSPFPECDAGPHLDRSRETLEKRKRHRSSSKENKRTWLAGKRKRKLKTPFGSRRAKRQWTFWSP